MGSPLKKLAKFSNKLNPHTWIMGEKASAQYDLAGQLTGAHDHLYKPKDIAPIPTDTADASLARDRMRRMVKKASGRDSTIRTSAQGATPYSAEPRKLLGS